MCKYSLVLGGGAGQAPNSKSVCFYAAGYRSETQRAEQVEDENCQPDVQGARESQDAGAGICFLTAN